MTITTADLAAEFGTDGRTTRKFLRDDARSRGESIPGKGSRWMIEKRDVRSLRSRFSKWQAAQDETRKAREAAREVEDKVEPKVLADALDHEPTDEELAEIESNN